MQQLTPGAGKPISSEDTQMSTFIIIYNVPVKLI